MRTAAVGVVLFLVFGGKACMIGSGDLRKSMVELVDQWQGEDHEDQEIEASLQQLLLQEQHLAMENAQGERSPEKMVDENTKETYAPEDLMEWEDILREPDADLLAEIDRENEAMRQQALLMQQQQNQQVQPIGGIQTLELPYSKEQLSSITFLKEKLYNVNRGTTVTGELLDADTLLSMDMTLQAPESDGPKVLIHHTHATEYFSDSDQKDDTTLIVGVGDYLEELLENKYGIQVIHDRTVYPYNEAYSQALKHVESILAENPTIEVFIDLHRDAGGTKKYTVSVDGKETAHLMFFNGLSHSANGPIEYLPNVNQQENLAFSFQMKMAGDSLYPGLCKRNYLKAYRYNLHVLPRAVIVEVGDNNNTFQEARNAMEPLARILYYVLAGEV